MFENFIKEMIKMTKRLLRGMGFSLIVIFMMFAFTSSILAVDSGWKSAVSYYDNDGVQNEHRAYSQDDQYAILNNDGDHVTYGFGNNLVPAGTVIKGIEVRYDAYRNTESARTLNFKLYEGSTPRGNTVYGGAIPTNDNDTYKVLGSSTNDWGYGSWDAAKINNLRVKVSVTDGHSNNYLDHIQVRVSYCYVNYSITYNLDGGTNSVNNPSTYNVATPTINFEDATKAGYTFAGWFSDSGFTNEVTSIPMGSTGNVMLYAKWVANEYNITYNLDGGINSVNNPATYNVATPTINFEDATKAGFLFAGWFSDSEFTNEVTSIPMGSTGDVVLYAKWIPDDTGVLETYNITYVLNGGTNDVDNPATYDIEDPDIVLQAPTRAGYLFAGWFDNSEFAGTAVTVLDTAAEVDYTVYAKWIEDTTGVLETYNITYVLNGGTNNVGNPATYDTEDPDIVLLAPTRTGYVFGGWFANAEFTGTAVTVLDTAAEVDYTVYAKWAAAPVTTVTELPQTGQFPVLIGAISTILFTGAGLAVLNKKR